MATRRRAGFWRPVIFCVLSLLVEADCNFAQTGSLPIRPAPNLELLDAKRKHLVIYAQDFLEATQMRDDLNEIESILHPTISSLSKAS